VKKAHAEVIPGMREYLAEFTSEKAWGEDGYLSDRGLIPMPEEERSKFAADAKNLTAMSM
jgi:phosphate transport system substrate-binding protein